MTRFGGRWTREKLEILRRYLNEYTTVMKYQRFRLTYVDAFAGSGTWQPNSGYAHEDYGDYQEFLKGSASLALEVRDRHFDRLVFIEQDHNRSAALSVLLDQHLNREIEIVPDDANEVLPKICNSMGIFDRAVVFLDPYATQVAWDTIGAIAETQKIDCWILFPLMAISRMMPLGEMPTPALSRQLDRIFGGREHWQDVYYKNPQLSYLPEDPTHERASGSTQIAQRYRIRLEGVFSKVAPTSRTLRNSKRAPIFELFFAASNPIGAKRAIPIADHILRNW